MKINQHKKRRWNVHEKIFLILIIIVLILGSVNIAKARGMLIPLMPSPQIQNKTISLDSLSLEQKIAQMVIVHGSPWNMEAWKKMQIGGIHLFALKDAELYQQTISKHQAGMDIPFMVTVDLEGCWNPFSYFRNFTAVSTIKSEEEAFSVGQEEALFLTSMGFTIDFSPVVDLRDDIWKCRSFSGDGDQITKLAQAYIKGLQSEGITATVKHYPGKTLIGRDPHKSIVAADISGADVYPFQLLAQNKELKGVMVSHVISSGEVNSEGKPAVVSVQALNTLRSNFSGIIFSDEVNMLGLKDFYSSIDDLYLDVFSAGNDVIVNFNEDPNEIYHMIQVIKSAVEEGKISSEQIDASVTRILELKGFRVI
ncbi:MAG: glycoside hydrolase family 3 N-terminal domain-containing protein [Candidatus Woesearchaeota archaeon]